MGQQEYDNFKRLIREWLDSHPNEYAKFVEEMNGKNYEGFQKVSEVSHKTGNATIQKSHSQTDKR